MQVMLGLSIGVVVAAVGACAGDAPTPSVPAGGFQAVEAMAIAGSTPDGAVLLESVSGAVLLENGTLVVADPLASALKFFSATGELVRTVGRHGRGPQEFTTIAWIARCDERIVAFDDNTGEISIVAERGGVERRFVPSAHPTQSMRMSFVRCAPGGRFAFAGFPRLLPGGCLNDLDQCRPMRSLVSIADAGGSVTDTVGEVFAGEMRPLGRLMQFAVSNHALYVGTSETDAVDVYDLRGAHTRTIPLGLAPRAPTQVHYDYAIRQRLAGSSSRAWQAEWTERLRGVPMPEALPPYSGLFTTRGGLLWVVVSIPGDTITWLRPLLPDGTIGPDVVIPRGMRVLDAGDAHVIGTLEDEITGEPAVILYHLRP